MKALALFAALAAGLSAAYVLGAGQKGGVMADASLMAVLNPETFSRVQLYRGDDGIAMPSWTPSVQQIETAERLIQSELDTKAPELAGKWQGYMRQYLGATIVEGQHPVYGNFFCDAMDADWRKELVRVKDGGDCYFQVLVDLEKEKVQHLMINGAA